MGCIIDWLWPDNDETGDDWLKKNYKVGKTLGKGGSCKVVKGDHIRTGESYAVKIMSKRDKMNQDLYDKEIKILGMLNHSNIIRLFEFATDGKNFYIATNLCSGGELFDRIVDKGNPITEKRASELVKTMLLAIKHCHGKNIVHRDLKPENFVFKDPSQNSEMVLIDFGCAKIVDDETVYKDLVGTPYYLAPESAAGHKYTRTGAVLKSSDIWSIGVIAYVLMTGRPPFNGHSNTEIFSNIIKQPLRWPNVKLSKAFKLFVTGVLKKSPKHRMKLDKALENPWVQGKEASDKAIDKDVIKVLSQFATQSKLKKAITKALAQHMGKEPKEKIKEHFDRLDKDNNGALDAEELSVLLMDMGVTKTEAREQADQIINNTDDDKSGTIEFDEFASIWQRKLLTANESYIHAVFNVLDDNGDGHVNAEELGKVLDVKDPRKMQELINDVDADNDGQLSFSEFRNAMMELGDTSNTVGHELKESDIQDASDAMGNVKLEDVV